MSSLPPPMPPFIPPPPTPAYGAAPQWSPPQQGSPVATNYGPVGTQPAAPGVSYFAEPASSKFVGTFMMIGGGIFVFFGVLMLFGAPSTGVIFTGLGALVGFLGWRSRTSGSHKDYVLDAYGITIRESLGKVPQPDRVVPWLMIASTACSSYVVRETSGEYGTNETTSTRYRFSLTQRDGSVVTIEEGALGKLPDLIQIVNAHTPQLPYRWVIAHLVRGIPIRATVGKYAQIGR